MSLPLRYSSDTFHHAFVGYSAWDFGRFTVPENQKRIVSPARHKLFLGSVDAIIRQLESPVVHRDASFCAENFVRSNGFFGSHVHRRHKPAWLICTDGQQCKLWRAKFFSNLGEMASETSVPCEVHNAFEIFNYVPAPQGLVTVKYATG